MNERLYIIGNGFDLAHGIPSRYSDFGQYLAQVDSALSDLVGDYLEIDKDYWNEFEERLAWLDYDKVLDHAADFLVPYGDDDWSDAYHHDYEYEIAQVVEGLSSHLRSRFVEWIRRLPTPARGSFSPIRCIVPSARFLSFNYTSTLQDFYRVPDANVTHIHGRSCQADFEIILGHGWERQADELLSQQVDEDTDVRVAGGYRLVDDYFAETFKPTENIIQQHLPFFLGLSSVSEVIVLGHSLADVDRPYFSELLGRIDKSATRWTISYHEEPTKEKAGFSQFGVDPRLVQFVRFRDL